MNKNSKILLIINPRSGRLKVRSQLFDIAECFSQSGYETSIFTTSGSGDAMRCAKDNADSYDLVVCRGGDGTLNEVLNGVMHAKKRVPIGYIPAGTSNDFAKTMGIPSNGKKAVDVIINRAPSPHDIGRFNDNAYFNYTACFGVFTKASYATPQKMKNVFGYGAYLTEGAKDITSLKTINMKITCDGKTLEGEYIFGAITNALCVGNFIKFDKNTIDFNDGIFELTLAKKPDSVKAWYDLLTGVRKKQFDERYITMLKGSEFIIEAESPVAWSLDGEYGGECSTTKISCIKGGIEIINNLAKV